MVQTENIYVEKRKETNMDIMNADDKKGYDPVTTAGIKLGNVLLLAGGICFFIRILIVTFTTMGMMQDFFSLIVVGVVLVFAGGGVYLLVGVKSTVSMLTSQNSERKKEYKLNILKSVRILTVIAGVVLVMLTSNTGVDLMPVVYLCIAVAAGITVVIIKKKH